MKAQKAICVLSKEKSLFEIVYIDPPYESAIEPLLGALHPLLAEGAILFLEERASKRSQALKLPPFLQHKNSRRFGIALLHQFSA
jgi:16S rRNA G966 N2-methylase RsmD